KPGFAVATREGVRPPVEDLELRLPGHGGVRGSVVDARGQPVRDFTVRIERMRPLGVSSPRPGGAATRYRDASGEFELYPLEPGSYDLAVDAPGLGATRVASVDVTSGEWTERTISLQAGGRIRG